MMRPVIAFKKVSGAMKVDDALGKIFTEAISQKTGSPYSHVEFWLKGPQNAAQCFSSREPSGTAWATIDLTDLNLWELVALDPISIEQITFIEYFCKGTSGRDYDAKGIVGVEIESNWHDGADRFCSEMLFDIGQSVLGWRTDIPRWKVVPGWPPPKDHAKGIYGLYELATGCALKG